MARGVFWLMGSFALPDWRAVGKAGRWVILGALPLWLGRWRLNALFLGDTEARALGMEVGRERLFFLWGAALAVASAVSVSGLIGWVGLMVPHLVRMLAGPDHRRVIPLSMTLGAAFLMVSDTLACTTAAGEITVGIITTVCGAPFSIYLLKRGGQEACKL